MLGVVMSNIELFRNAFTVTFPQDTANQLLGHMQALYGDGFNKKFGEIGQERMINTVCQVLDGLREEDLQRGIQRMKTEKWCPSIPEFRAWCLQDFDWWTADQAWAFALGWKKDHSKPITILAKRTINEVSEVLNLQGQKAAYKAFVDTYEFNLRQAKIQKCTQLMWKKPESSDAKKAIQQAERTRTGITCPVDLVAQIKSAYRVREL